MSSPDYYEIIGVQKNSSAEDIRKGYRKKSKECHPDLHPNDEKASEKFTNLSEAYSILSDSEKRKQYDEFGADYFKRGTGGSRNPHFEGDLDDLRDFFQQHMGQTRMRQRRSAINPDIKVVCRITLQDAIKGGKIGMQYDRSVACESCKGNGHIKKNECNTCRGQGTITQQIQENVYVRQSCPNCQGTGGEMEDCNDCRSEGYLRVDTKLNVKIPEGVVNMSVLRLKKKGNAVFNGKNKIEGDLQVVIDYPTTEDGITMKNGDIYTTVQAPMDRLIAGDQIIVDIGCKRIKFDLNPKHPSGYEYIINNGGAKKGKNAYIKVFADFPQNDIDEGKRKELVKIWREVYGCSKPTVKPATI